MWDKKQNILDVASWFGRKIFLIEEKDKVITSGVSRKIYRGGVYWVELGYNIGAEKTKTRPCLVISAEFINNGESAIVIPISTKFPKKFSKSGRALPKFNNHYMLYKSKYNKLDQDSAVKTEDIKSVDNVRIRGFIFNIDKDDMKEISKCIDYSLGYRINKRSKKYI